MSARKTTLRYRASLPELFPPDEPSSHWMLRLSILRHDLRFEVSQLGLSENATPDDVFRTTYFLRRMSITLLEAENVLGFELGKLLKEQRDVIPSDLAAELEVARKAISSARPAIQAVRDIIGAHMRQKNDADDQPALTREILRTHHGYIVDVAIDTDTLIDTDMREIAMASFLYAWPEATDDTGLEAKHAEYQAAALVAARNIMRVIDALLFTYWSDLGIKHKDA